MTAAKPVLPPDRRRRAGGTLQLDDGTLSAACLGQPRPGQPALQIGVIADARDEQRRIGVDRSVGDEYGDIRGLRLLQHRRPSIDDDRCNDDRIDPFRDEAPYRSELPVDAPLCIVEMEIDAAGLGLRLHVGRERGAPVALGSDL